MESILFQMLLMTITGMFIKIFKLQNSEETMEFDPLDLMKKEKFKE
jgi:hypothetical protein